MSLPMYTVSQSKENPNFKKYMSHASQNLLLFFHILNTHAIKPSVFQLQ